MKAAVLKLGCSVISNDLLNEDNENSARSDAASASAAAAAEAQEMLPKLQQAVAEQVCE